MTETSYKRGDTVPIEATLPVDLSNASSVTFKMGDGETSVVSGSATIDNASDGDVSYSWGGNETDRTGPHYVEWEVEYNDGTIETFPKKGTDEVYFYDDVS